MHKIVFSIITGLVLIAFISCEEKVGVMNQPAMFSVQPFSVPGRISVSSVRTYTLAFKVTHPEGVDAVTSVSVVFLGGDQSTELLNLNLYDDGGFNNPGDGDVIARDGVFTNTFLSDSSVFPLGTIYILATAVDKHQEQLTTDFISSFSILNATPVIISASVPDTLFSGSQPLLFSVTIQDSNQIDDIENVTIDLKKQGLSVFSTSLELVNSISEDTAQFGTFFDSSFAVERVGDYELEFQAKDLSGDFSELFSVPIYLENEAPSIFNLQMVDSLKLPSGSQVNTTLITIQTNDPQGLMDIDSIYFNSFLPNDSAATNNPFIMYDNGLPYDPNGSSDEAGDLVANDGIYSLTIGLFSNTPTGRYKFLFFARDKVGQLTPGPVDSIFVYQ